MESKNQPNVWLCLIPLIVSLSFAALMLYFAVISTKGAREHYRAKRFIENVQRVGQFRLTPQGMREGTATPAKPKNFFTEYETGLPLMALPLLFVGLYFARMIFAQLPDRNPFAVSDLMRRSLMVMICSFILAPACLIFYVWALRIGLIG